MRRFLATGLTLLASGMASAAKSMWTLNRLPLRHLEQAYGFTPDAAWSLHAQCAVVMPVPKTVCTGTTHG